LDCINPNQDRLLYGKCSLNLAVSLSILAVDQFDGKDFETFRESKDLFEQGMDAMQSEASPEEIAQANSDFGIALKEYGMRFGGVQGADLLRRSVAVQSDAAAFFTPESHAVRHATCRENLAFAEDAIAHHPDTTDPVKHLRLALSHIEAALLVFDPETMPQPHAKATRLRDRLLSRLSDLDPQ